jgi:hypothetical protein
MMVHSLLALAPLAALAFILVNLRIEFFSFQIKTWDLIVKFSVVVIFLLSIPSLVSGIAERNKMYAKWHFTHKVKTILSVLLVLATFLELIGLILSEISGGLLTWLGLGIICINNVLCFLLSYFGLKITLGRQSLKKPSYVPDLFQEGSQDILEKAGQYAKEEPKFVDILQER